jgi:farnesyl diphosphate synthase
MAAAATATVALSNGSSGDSKAEFAEIYTKLKQEMLEDPAFEFTDESLQWIDRVRPPVFSISVFLVVRFV